MHKLLYSPPIKFKITFQHVFNVILSNPDSPGQAQRFDHSSPEEQAVAQEPPGVHVAHCWGTDHGFEMEPAP